ncbi:MAG: YitT family protein [Clostridia bacterium]|nr:YitT family protein [Clostridia bacterium]
MVTKKQMQAAETERALIAEKKSTAKDWLVLIAGILVAGLLRAVSIYSFVVPNNFAPGGVTGIASMLEYKLHINAGYFLLGINVPLLIIAFIFIGKRFAITSGIAIVLSSALMVLFEKVDFYTFSTANTGADQLLAAIAGGILGGAGIAILLKLGGSSGGTDILAVLIQKKHSGTNVAWFIFMIDSIVVFASAFIYDNPIVPILLSLVEMFVSSKVNETILQGFKSAIKFEIVTGAESADELAKDIMQKLHRGVTMLPAKGMYTGVDRAMLVCILRKRQMSNFRDILKKYPNTFAYVSGTSEVVGQGFKN